MDEKRVSPIDDAIEQMADGKLLATAIEGEIPDLDEHWSLKSGWLVLIKDEARVDNIFFHGGKAPSRKDAAELEKRLGQLRRHEDFDPKLILGILSSREVKLAVLFVNFVHDRTGQSAWLIYRHPILRRQDAEALASASYQLRQKGARQASDQPDDKPSDQPTS